MEPRHAVNIDTDFSGWKWTIGVTYILKMRVETLPGGTPQYSFKIWEQGQTEPSGWTLSGTGESYSLQKNGFLLPVSSLRDKL